MDLVHVFWRPFVKYLYSQDAASYAQAVGYRRASDLLDLVLSKRITTAVYDHLYVDERGIDEFQPIFAQFVDAYYTSSAKLDAIYRRLYPCSPPTATLSDGVDLMRFRPKNLGRLNVTNKPLVVGWVGNSEWGSEYGDIKGLRSKLAPAVESLKAEGKSIQLLVADRAVSFIPHEQMPKYYAKIDVLVCVSQMEGTPNPVLEAMACGVPIISTDVGIVSEAFGFWQSQFILRDRTVESLKAMLRNLCEDREMLGRLSRENLSSIEDWSWSKKASQFDAFFEAVLSRPIRDRSSFVPR